jgi:hypothetical protein
LIIVPVLIGDAYVDRLLIHAVCTRGRGRIRLAGNIPEGVEDEINKITACAQCLADYGEFKFPDLSNHDIRVTFSFEKHDYPVRGSSYALGLGVSILSAFSGRIPPADLCFSAGLDEQWSTLPVEGIDAKRSIGTRAIMLHHTQLNLFESKIDQIPVSSLPEAWSVLTYGDPRGNL